MIETEAHKKIMGPEVPWRDPLPIKIEAIADTGAQTCTAGTGLLTSIKGSAHWLLKTKHRIRGVTNDGLQIRGALIAKISTNERSTTQIIYVCDNVSNFYLSQTSLKELQIIDHDFPAPPNAQINAMVTTANEATGNAPCGCPLRTECPQLPDKLPLPATSDNRAAIEIWIKEFFASSAFNTCTHQKLQAMSGDPLNITFREDYTPSAVHKPIPIPHHWKAEVKTKIDADVALGIIEAVPQGTPTLWCSRMVVVPKKDGTPRRTVDLQNLNKATLRETHHTPTPFHTVSVIPKGKVKTVLDAWNGYHSVPLSAAARDATTFISEWGRYRYLRAPQGFHASNDGYTKRFDDITAGFPRVVRIIDDSLLWDDDIATSFWHTVRYINLCSDNGIVFNPDKFKFARNEIEFAGFDITSTGYQPPKRLLQAIQEFPTPTNITGIRSWFGLVNQVSYAFAQAPIMAPFRELLAHHKHFYWDETLDGLLQQSKDHIIAAIKDGVRTFETNRVTCLSTDWSKTGIGFLLSQKHCSCPFSNNPLCGVGHWKVVYAGSRFTRDAESRYAPIEGESLALLFGLESCKMFVMGCPNLIVAVDHKPLVRIFNGQYLNEIKNPRILTFREKTLMFKFTVVAIPGALNIGPDAMSRIPLPSPHPPSLTPVIASTSEIESTLEATVTDDPMHGPVHMKRVLDVSTHDREYQDLLQTIRNGFPGQKNDVPINLREFWPLREELYTVKELVFLQGKVLIPQPLRKLLLDYLHEGHQGIVAMKENARRRFFWPGMSKQIQNRRYQCRTCNEKAPSQARETPISPTLPSYPFQHAATDIFNMAGRKFLVYTDRFSGWTETASTYPDAKASTICNILRRYFITFGVPGGDICRWGSTVRFEGNENLP